MIPINLPSPEMIDRVAQWSAVTTIGLIVLLSAVGLYDASVSVIVGSEATVTAVVRGVASRHPILAFLCGVVVGHLFWSQ